MANQETNELHGPWLGPKGVQQIWSLIFANYVAKVADKGLSTNDFTNELLSKLNGIADGSQVNVIESVKVNNVDVDIVGKAVNITVPKGTLADLNEVSETNLAAALATKINGKVDAVEGMGLSHNDYDDAAKAEVAKIVGKADVANTYTKNETEQLVDQKIKAATTSCYKVKGSVNFADLSLEGVSEGFTYNVNDAFTSTEDFKDGAGLEYPAGTNVVAVNVGTEESPEYKWDPQSGTYDFSGFVMKSDIRELTAEEIAAICVMPGADQTA